MSMNEAASGYRLKPAAAIVRLYGEQYRGAHTASARSRAGVPRSSRRCCDDRSAPYSIRRRCRRWPHVASGLSPGRANMSSIPAMAPRRPPTLPTTWPTRSCTATRSPARSRPIRRHRRGPAREASPATATHDAESGQPPATPGAPSADARARHSTRQKRVIKSVVWRST